MNNQFFIEAFKKTYPSSFSRYSGLEDEVLFSFKPLFVERWLYEDGIPYIESTDIAKSKYKKIKYI